MPLVAVRSRPAPELVIATANSDEAVGFRCVGQTEPCAILLLRSYELPDGGMALFHPATLRYLCAPKPQAARNAEPLVSADRRAAWERFRAEKLPSGSVRASALQRLATAERLAARRPTADLALACVKERWPHAAAALDGVLASMETAELDELARRLVAEPKLLADLAAIFPHDVWANDALPGLARWLAQRDATAPPSQPGPFAKLSGLVGRRTESAPKAAVRRQIGPEHDVLARLERPPVFASLPQACAARARRSVEPSRTLAMLATARNEGIYLVEWLAYHRLLGVEAFFVYSNNNDDGSDALLGALADAGVITWISSRIGTVISAQNKAYGHALGCLPDLLDYAWALVLDIDEFLVLDTARHADAVAFCDWHAARGAESVAINWQFMAPETADPLTQPVTRRHRRLLTAAQMGEGVRLVKSMSRPNRVMQSEAHVAFADPRGTLRMVRATGEPHSWHKPPDGFPHSPKFADRVTTGNAVVNHYIFRSAEEWLVKGTRNRGSEELVPGAPLRFLPEHSARAFMSHLYKSKLEVDDRAIRMTPGLDDEIARLSRLPGVTAAQADVQTRYRVRLDQVRDAYRGSADVRKWDAVAQEFLALAGC